MITEKWKKSLIGMSPQKINAEFLECSEKEDFDRMTYLLTSDELVNHANIRYFDNVALRNACIEGTSKLVKYLISDKSLKIHADINIYKGGSWKRACENGRLDVIKVILESPHVSTYTSLDMNELLKIACKYNRVNIIDYLVFEYKMQGDINIKHYLKGQDKEYIVNIFEKRELEKRLHITLPQSVYKSPKIKI